MLGRPTCTTNYRAWLILVVMKIASYNIMSGGFAKYSHDVARPERLHLILTVVKEIDADVIGLIDTFRWDKTFSTQELKDLFGYKYILRTNLNDSRLAASGGESIGMVLMSKHEWKNPSVVRLDTRDALKADFEIDGKEFTLFLAYLDDLKEEVRLRQAKALLKYVHNIENTIIMGDLNTFAPADIPSVNDDIKEFYNDNPGIKAKLGPVLTEMQKGKVVQLLEASGLKDVGVHGGLTIPTKLFPAVVAKPFLRVDYCFTGTGLVVSNFMVHASNATDAASDHLPISFTVQSSTGQTKRPPKKPF